MELDLTTTIVIGGLTLGISFPLTMKFASRIKKALSKTRKGNATTIQTAPIEAEGVVTPINTGNGSSSFTNTGSIGGGANIFNNTGSVTITKSSASQTEKLAAQRNVRRAFQKFFYTYLGTNGFGGMLTHKPNLHRDQPNTFAAHYEFAARSSSQTAKEKLETEVKECGRLLNNAAAETSFDNLVQRLVKTAENPFQITEDLKTRCFVEIDDILGKINS